MSRVTTWITTGWLVALPVLLPAQLPPEIQLDRYLLRAGQQATEGKFLDAMESLERILELQEQHGVELPETFLLTYAEVSLRVGLYSQAIESVTRYLTLTGREGEHYRGALRLLDSAEAAKAAALEAAEEAQRRLEESRRKAEAARAAAEEARKKAAAVIAAMEFVWIPPGEFRMGSTSSRADDDERPRTRVRISEGFYLGKYEVTQELYQAVMGTNPSHFSGCDRCPVEEVSWDDAQEFVERLNARSAGTSYRLPTEAEWEYAARAGTRGDDYPEDLDAIAWHEGNSGDRTRPVGQKAPNAWGLHDMLGNVYEWVQDWYGTYPGGRVADPRGPSAGRHDLRVYRGCSWFISGGPNDTTDCRPSSRLSWGVLSSPDRGSWDIGFRLLRAK